MKIMNIRKVNFSSHIIEILLSRAGALALMILVLSTFMFACKDDDEPTQPSHPSSNTYVTSYLNNQLSWDSEQLSTSYVKIPQISNPEWFDIVLEQDTLCGKNRYLYIHATNPLVKNFSFDSVITLTSGFSVIYYEGKKTQGHTANYDLYLTTTTGTLTITSNDSQYLSGEFSSQMIDVISSQSYQVRFIFNHLPIEIVGKRIFI